MSEVRGDYPKISTGHPDAGRAFANALDSSLARESKLIADFDLVTAERDAAQGSEAALREEREITNRHLDRMIEHSDALQQRLTAADERADSFDRLYTSSLDERDQLQQRADVLERVEVRYRWLQKATPYQFKKIQDASVTDGGDVLYFHADRFDAAVDAALKPA